MVGQYIIENGVVRRAVDTAEWAVWIETCERHLAETMVGKIWVSTVFLGLDHSFSLTESAPVLWETMIFWKPDLDRRAKGDWGHKGVELPGDLGDYQARYRSEAEALRGHRVAVEKAREFFPDEPVINKPCELGKRPADFDEQVKLARATFEQAGTNMRQLMDKFFKKKSDDYDDGYPKDRSW